MKKSVRLFVCSSVRLFVCSSLTVLIFFQYFGHATDYILKVKDNKAIVFLSEPDFYEVGDKLSIKNEKGDMVGSASLLKIKENKGIIKFNGQAGKGYEIVQKYLQPEKNFLSQAGKNRRGFFELNVRSVMLLLYYGDVGLGYKAELGFKNYFGYFLAALNSGVAYSGFDGVEIDIFGMFNLEYGYEFMRQRLFSFGFNTSLLWLFISPRLVDEDGKPGFVSTGMFGNFNIRDSFKIAIKIAIEIEVKGLLFALDVNDLAIEWMFWPVLEIKGRYYF